MLDAYSVVGLSLRRDFGDASAFVQVENVLDASYERFGLLGLNVLGGEENARVEPFITPGLPRRVYAGLSYRF